MRTTGNTFYRADSSGKEKEERQEEEEEEEEEEVHRGSHDILKQSCD